MAETIIGRKRTADGVLVEVRVIGDAPADELTLYARQMLRAADRVNAKLRAARVALEHVTAELSRGKL